MSQTGGSVPVQPALSELQAKLQQGVAFHQRGMFAEAERLYEEVLKREPSHFDALHLLGVVALQTRRTERGVALIREAIKLNAHIAVAHVLGALSQCDVFLDSIGWSGCNSTLESLAHDLPIVTMRGQLMRGRHSSAILQMMGIAETIAESVEDYISVAARLANDPRDRQALGRKIAIRKHALYRDRQCISAFEDFLERAVRQHAV